MLRRGGAKIPQCGSWQKSALVYSLPGTWVSLDVTTFDYFADTGEVSWLGSPLGLAFDEIGARLHRGLLPGP